MKQFNLQEYLKNPDQKIVTRNGRNVRIICTDRMQLLLDEHYPIVALIKNHDDSERIACFKNNGQAHDNKDIDLFFAPEKKTGWINLYKDKDDIVTDKFIIHSEKDALIQ